MEKKDMIQALVAHYCKGNKAQFANILGIKPQTINSWIARNTFDAELIFAKCVGVSAEWLLSGNGEMLKSSNALPADQSMVDKLLAVIQDKSEEIGRLKARITQLESQQGGNAYGVHSSGTANAG